MLKRRKNDLVEIVRKLNSKDQTTRGIGTVLAILIAAIATFALLLVVALFIILIIAIAPIEYTPTIIWGAICFVAVSMFGCICVAAVWIYYRRRSNQMRLAAWRKAMAELKIEISERVGQPDNWLRQLSWQELEEFSSRLFQRMGYRTDVVGRSGDHGVDVRLKNPSGQLEVAQCKQWGNPVGEPELRNLYGAMLHEGAVRGFIIAPQGFTGPAHSWVKGKPIVLLDLHRLNHLVETIYKQES